MFLSHRIWFILFFSISTVCMLSVPVYNYFIDYNLVFNNSNNPVYHRIQEGVELLNTGVSIRDNSYNFIYGAIQRVLHLKSQSPEILILGTSRTMLISQEHLPFQETILNASVHGGHIPGIVGLWQIYKNHIQDNEPSVKFAFIEVYPYPIPGARDIPSIYFSETKQFLNEFCALNLSNIDLSIYKIKQLLSLRYFIKNIQFSLYDEFTATNNAPDIRNIRPDGSYILQPIQEEITLREAIEHGLMLQNYTEKDLPNLSIISELALDIKRRGITPIFLLPPYHPITYDLILEKNNILVSIEERLHHFAEQNNIKIVGSFNPHQYQLGSEYFRNGNHSTADMWNIIFKELKLPE
ncbi:hypothetical protein PVA45_04570 [Entomospira entomophila]|uniref:Uncharacterized protein n=1 Tax=Entomospira entomophila TaxID=2719988 RepID=A0A968GD43_9SPIO|nr:hypothetical protein [Entomospira entomophilus]NIZ40779.1 hypothetical protein [Entomospira entomophilus]WDI34992.1 hypothetical protein PVA45_04570 [Entomospira entomophilus]